MTTYRVRGAVAAGWCTLLVDADSKEEAISRIKKGEWDVAADVVFDVEPDVDLGDDEKLNQEVQEY